VEPRELLRRFPRPTDAAFAAGAAVDHGAIDLADLPGQLPDRVVRRLSARATR
jgi:hypothetical protein